MKGEKIIFAFIVVLALFLRVYNINWDQNQHLHPDERFLTMVGIAEKIPATISEYLDPNKSTLNPYNVNYPFFVYGTFPLSITKIAAVMTHLDDYNNFTLVGRFLSALSDVATVIVIYFLVLLWQKKYAIDPKIALFAAFFYAIAVLPIQHAHFFVTDSFLVLFLTASVYYMTNYLFTTHKKNICVAALFFGLAVASKVSALYSAPLLGGIYLLSLKKNNWRKTVLFGIFFIVIVYCVVRIADPKFFATAAFLNPTLNPKLLLNLEALKSYSSGPSWFPPGLQWINKPAIIFSLYNLAFFGVGVPYFLLSIVGMFELLKKRNTYFMFLIFWTCGFYVYQSTQFVKSVRYFLVLYPYVAIFAGVGLVSFWKKLERYRLLRTLLIISVVVWPISFMTMYSYTNSRVAASEWMYKTIPDGAYLAEEHWDDWLPLHIITSQNKTYKGEQMPVFDQDTEEKWVRMREILEKSDYYVITSSRAYKHILANPDRYPKMSAFYRDLFAGKTVFKKVAEFSSYPTFPLYNMLHSTFFVFNDDEADEGFTVFDHPKVTIFKKTSPL